MILIADAGATKTDWRLIEGENVSQFRSGGFNPRTHSISYFINSISQELILRKSEVTHLYYYGAGLTDGAIVSRLRGLLAAEFNRSAVEVETDLMGAARSLFGREAGIACILGTGSAACMYDGNAITHRIPSLGYVLGDEGSGAYLGRGMLNQYLRGRMPELVREKFEREFGSIPEATILERVYAGEKVSSYIAAFSSFVINNQADPFVYQFAYKSIEDFFVTYFGPFTKLKGQKIRLTGSIAYFLSNIIRKFASDHQLNVDLISQSPIAGLTLYHKAYG